MKTVIEMAREAGDDEWKILIKHVMKHFPSEFHRFAELVRADAIADEREACAKVCDWYVDYSSNPMNFAENCAQEIRARSNT